MELGMLCPFQILKPDPNPKRIKLNKPDKNRFVRELKTCISKNMMFCVLLYILFYDLVEISFVNNICYYFVIFLSDMEF